MARIKGGRTGDRGKARGKGRGRGRGRGAQANRTELVTRTESSSRIRVPPQKSPL